MADIITQGAGPERPPRRAVVTVALVLAGVLVVLCLVMFAIGRASAGHPAPGPTVTVYRPGPVHARVTVTATPQPS